MEGLKEKGNDILVIAPSNDLRDKISASIRKNYISGTSESILVYTNTYKTKAQISDLREYNGQEIVSFEKDIKNLGIKSGDAFEIDKINHKKPTINNKSPNDRLDKGNIDLIRIGDNKKISWNPTSKNEFVSLHNCKAIDIAKGEKIRWTKNSKKHSFITNGETATIEYLGKKKVEIKTSEGKKHSVGREDIRFMDYGYTASTYSSQGKTSDYAIGIVRARERFATLSHQRSFYVTLSRAAKEAYLVIDNYKDLIQSLGKKDGDKTSSMEHQNKLDKNHKAVIQSPEAKDRAKIIKSTMNKLIKEYDGIEGIRKNQDSLSSYLENSIRDFKLSKVQVSKVQEDFMKNSAYARPQDSLNKWNDLVSKIGLKDALNKLESNPKIIGELNGKEILFFKNKERKNAVNKVRSSIVTLTNLSEAKDRLNINKLSIKDLEKKYSSIYKEEFNFKTSGISYNKMKKDIVRCVKESLLKIDNVNYGNIIANSNNSKNTVFDISKRVSEKVVEFKTRFKKEPSILDKADMFIKAKHEYEMKHYYKKELSNKNAPRTKLEKIKQLEKADKLSKIDANLAKKNYGQALERQEQNKIYNSYNQFEIRIEKLTDSYIKQGYNKDQANNIANKIVGYEIDNNHHPSIRKIKTIEQVSRTFNLDRTVINNMGLNEKDTINILSKIESIEVQKLNSKQEKELGFYTSDKVNQNKESTLKKQVFENKQPKNQALSKNIDTEIEI